MWRKPNWGFDSPRDHQALLTSTVRRWRNWQTHGPQEAAAERSWGFEAPLAHHLSGCGVMAAARVSKARAERREGSSPSGRTNVGR